MKPVIPLPMWISIPFYLIEDELEISHTALLFSIVDPSSLHDPLICPSVALYFRWRDSCIPIAF